MGKKIKEIDEYIAKSQDFAKPILKKLRAIVHQGCPYVEEKIKWGFPHFDYKGVMCSMASFKMHSSFFFWKHAYMQDKNNLFVTGENSGMGNFGKLTSVKDLPSDEILIEYLKEAVKLNDAGVKIKKPPKPAAERKELVIPDYLIKAFSRNKKAAATFTDFSYSNKKEYVDWITSAKTEATRINRLETALDWLAEGKPRNWKHLKKYNL